MRRKEERELRCEPIGLSAPLPAGLTGGQPLGQEGKDAEEWELLQEEQLACAST